MKLNVYNVKIFEMIGYNRHQHLCHLHIYTDMSQLHLVDCHLWRLLTASQNPCQIVRYLRSSYPYLSAVDTLNKIPY